MTSMTPREACLESTRLGLQLYAQGQQHEALEVFDTALARDDTICLTWVGKGKALLELQRYPEAQAAFERALFLDPTNADAHHGKTAAHEATRRIYTNSVAGDLITSTPEALDGIAALAQLGYHALMALLHC